MDVTIWSPRWYILKAVATGSTFPGPPTMSGTLAGSPSFSSPITDVSGTFGGVFVGAYISLALYGLFAHQAFQYFTLYGGSDACWLKSLVIVALILETFVSATHIHLTYFYFVANYGQPLAFFEDVWSLNIFSTVSACIMITCQSFYATRILLMGPTNVAMYLPVVASGLLMAGAMGVSIAITVIGFQGLTADNFQTFMTLMLTYNVIASGGDVILTATVTYILQQCRTGFKRTDGLINRLILYTVSTGLLTTIFNILSVILIQVLGINNWAWLGTMMVAERLYSNSLMAALNSRKFSADKHAQHARNGRRADPFGTAVRISTVRFDHGPGLSATDEELELSQIRVRGRRSELEGGASGSTLGGVENFKEGLKVYHDG